MITEFYGVKDNACEWAYVHGIIDNLSEMSDDYMMHVVSVTPEWDHRYDVELSKDRRNIILALHDEYMTDCILDEWKDTEDVLVFKSYLMPGQEESNVYPLPLGFNKKHIKMANRPIKDRPVDIFFSGHMASQNRRHYMRAVVEFFEDLPRVKHPKLDVNITKGFNMGYGSLEYSERLHNAKIVICPAGNVSTETFRHYEGLRSGTVVVTPRLPQNEIFKGSYMCQVDDWESDVGPVLMDLLSDTDMLQLIKDKQDSDYQTRYSVKAVADYIYSKL